MRSLLATFLACSLVTASLAARAQSMTTPPPGYVPLELHADRPGTRYDVYDGDRLKHLAVHCDDDCTLYLPRGLYRVKSLGAISKSTEVYVDAPTFVKMKGGDSEAKWIGLAIGSAGSAAAIIGLTGALLSSCNALGDGACKPGDDARYADARNAFLITAGVGAAMSVVGWILFASNGNQAEVSKSYAAWKPPPVSIGAAPLSGGGFAIAGGMVF